MRAVVLLSRTAVLLQAVLQVVVVVVVVATRVAVVSGPVLVLLLLLLLLFLLLLLKVGWTPRLSSEEFDPAARAWTVGTAPPVVDLPLPLLPVAAARVCRPSHLRPAAV